MAFSQSMFLCWTGETKSSVPKLASHLFKVLLPHSHAHSHTSMAALALPQQRRPQGPQSLRELTPAL